MKMFPHTWFSQREVLLGPLGKGGPSLITMTTTIQSAQQGTRELKRYSPGNGRLACWAGLDFSSAWPQLHRSEGPLLPGGDGAAAATLRDHSGPRVTAGWPTVA